MHNYRILAAQFKQTSDTIQKHQDSSISIPWGRYTYLQKNITFPKGLTQKLIPKYIEPYKILRDFKITYLG